MLITVKKLNEQIEKVANAERVTKKQLGEFSRDALAYILTKGTTNADKEEVGSFDIQPINRMLSALTPINRKTAVLYFDHFLPFSYDDEQNKFVAGVNKKTKTKKVEEAVEFLAVDENTIWSWAEKHVKIEKKPIDFSKQISTWVGKALNDEDHPLTASDVFKAVLQGGLTVEEIINAMDEIQDA